MTAVGTENWATRLAAQLDTFGSPTGEQHYRTAVIRQDLGWVHIAGMLPGEKVHIRYWKHQYDPTTGAMKPLYFMAKTDNFADHFQDGTYATVYNAALETLAA